MGPHQIRAAARPRKLPSYGSRTPVREFRANGAAMPVVNRINAFAEDMTAWRRHLHGIPELAFDCHETAAFVAERLRAFGVDDLHEGIATTGIVAIIEGQGDGRAFALP